MSESVPPDFNQIAAEEQEPTLLAEFWEFLRCHKKWWLVPIVLTLLLLGLFLWLLTTPAAPFIYPFF